MRSMLFLPGDNEKKIGKGAGFAADALVLDLEDSVVVDRKPLARELSRAYLDANPPAGREKKILARINPLHSGWTLDDLAAIVGGAPDAVLLPKYRLPENVTLLDNWLTALEVRDGVAPGTVKIMVIGTETAQGVLNLAGLTGISDRLSHIMWGEYDLGADIGAQDQFLEDGSWDDLYRMARSMCLAAAVSAGVDAINTMHGDYKDPDGLRRKAEAARKAGFTGMPAIHPDQCAIINEAFSVGAKELDWSRRVIQAFADNPTEGTVGLDGIMLDLPHLTQARKIVARAEAQGVA